MASNNYIYKMSNAGGMSTIQRYTDMLAGNTTWNPWEPDGAYDALATVTVPSGGLSSITFAGIPNTYKHLQIRAAVLSTESYFRINFNNDTASNYSWHEIYGDGSGVFAGSGSNTSFGVIETAGPGITSTPGSLICDILDYGSTNKNKTIRTLSGYDKNGSGRIHLVSSLWRNSADAINEIDITINTGTINQYSQFTLYGVR